VPVQSCNPADRGHTYNSVAMELPIADGRVLAECRADWDGVSQWPDCDGPVFHLRVRNTASVVAYALEPGKKKGEKWVEIPPGTDTLIGPGQRNQLGLENLADVRGVAISANPEGTPTAAPGG
jgi:hypothetical protein